MKKKHIGIIVAAGIVIIVFFILGMRFVANLSTEKIELNYWNDPHASYIVCQAKVKDEVTVIYRDCTAAFKSNSKKEDIVATNKEAYLGEITYVDDCLKYPASLFYHDNNYYILFYDENFGLYRVHNCYLVYNYRTGSSEIYVPSPVYLNVSENTIQYYLEDYDENMLDHLFDNCTFEEAEEFYGRLSKEYVEIDKEKKQITVDGYALRQRKIIDKCITIDFAKREIIGIDDEGNYNTITGLE